MDEGVKGYFEFCNTKRYANLKTSNVEEYCQNIKADGWATSSTYTNSLLKDYIEPYGLRRFDVGFASEAVDKKTHWPMLKLGSNGADVKELQHLLNDAMGDTGAKLKEDGSFGQLTYMAVVEFQGRNDLKKDGVVGEKTWTKLIKG